MLRSAMFVLPALFFASVLLAQKQERIHLNPADPSTDFYIALVPEKLPVRGLLVLLDGFGADPADVLKQTELPRYAAQQGLITVLPLLATGPLYFGVDSASQASLQRQITDAMARYQLNDVPLYVGGFSIGGSCAVRYAQLAAEDKLLRKPTAVFAIDAPLDWERFFNGAQRVLRLSGGRPVNEEVTYMTQRLQDEMGGSPEQARANYLRLSPFSATDSTQQAVRKLARMPVMIVVEPDIDWWLRERGYDLSYSNYTDHVGMINELNLLGNTRAVLVTTTNKGYREPGHRRHPHSWSVADPKVVVAWLLAQTRAVANGERQ